MKLFSGLLLGIALVAASFAATRALNDGSSAAAGPQDPPTPAAATVPPDGEVHGPEIYGGVGQEHPPGPDVTPIPGTTPDTTKSWWYVPYLNAERGKPVSVQTINGITFGPGLEAKAECGGKLAVGTPDQVTDPALRISHESLPPGKIIVDEDFSLLCDGQANRTELQFHVLSDPAAGIRGGSVLVTRFRGEPVIDTYIPDHRWSAGTVAGHPAVIARPILPNEGLGESAVLVYLDGVLTLVYGADLPLPVVLEYAEAQFR